jgi:hypothetical protein
VRAAATRGAASAILGAVAAEDPPPPPLDYASHVAKTPGWSRQKKVIVSVLTVVGVVLLFYLGVCVVFVASNINNR